MFEVVDVRAFRMAVWRYRLLIAGAVMVWAAVGTVLTRDIPKSLSASTSVEFNDAGIPGVRRALEGTYQRQYLIELVGQPEAAKAVAASGNPDRLDIERYIHKNIFIEYKTARLDIRVIGYEESATRWLVQKLLTDIESNLDPCFELATKLKTGEADIGGTGANQLDPFQNLAMLSNLAKAEARLQMTICRNQINKEIFPNDKLGNLLGELDSNVANHQLNVALANSFSILNHVNDKQLRYLNQKRVVAVRDALKSNEQHRAALIARAIVKRNAVVVETTPSKYLLLMAVWSGLGLIIGLVVVFLIQLRKNLNRNRFTK